MVNEKRCLQDIGKEINIGMAFDNPPHVEPCCIPQKNALGHHSGEPERTRTAKLMVNIRLLLHTLFIDFQGSVDTVVSNKAIITLTHMMVFPILPPS